MSDEQKLTAAIKALHSNHGSAVFEIGFGELVALIGNVQLALRHPGNRGYAAQVARKWLDEVIADLESREPDCALLRRGDDPAHDVPFPVPRTVTHREF